MKALNLDQMIDSLVVDGFDPAQKLDWLERSYEAPEDFFQGILKAYHVRHTCSSKSLPFRQYDFYYDIFETRRNREDTAYIYYDINLISHEITYRNLQQMVDKKAGEWRSKGAVKGESIALVYDFNIGYVVSVLASLKIGLVFSLIAPSRPYLLKKQLESLEPVYISTDDIHALIMQGCNEKIIENMPEDLKKEKKEIYNRSNAPASKEVIARLFDYSTDQLFEPFDITCDELYLRSICDGILALQLEPGDILAAPGYKECESQPSMFLSALLTGAAFLDIKKDNYNQSSEILFDYPVTVLGVNSELRDFLQEKQIDNIFKSCRFWFRNPAQSAEYNQWYMFISDRGLDKILTGVLKWHIQIGGILFFSRRRRGLAVDNIMPSAGLEWVLTEPEQIDDNLSTEFGILSVSFDNMIKVTPWLVKKNMYEWLLIGSRFKESEGRYYPCHAVHNLIKQTNICRYSFMAEKPILGGNSVSFDLIIFTGKNSRVKNASLSDKLNRYITHAMGKEYCPDKIVFYPILPRFNADFLIDTEWCELQYFNGGLAQKSGDSIFRNLSVIKEMILKQV